MFQVAHCRTVLQTVRGSFSGATSQTTDRNLQNPHSSDRGELVVRLTGATEKFGRLSIHQPVIRSHSVGRAAAAAAGDEDDAATPQAVREADQLDARTGRVHIR